METSIPSLVLVQCLKSLLNWLVVLVQRHYMIRFFSGFFSISLALIDTLASCVLVAIFYLENFSISGFHISRNHIWLLAQIASFIYAHLHWPVFLLTGLDHIWSQTANISKTQKLTYVAGVGLVWILGAMCVFSGPELVHLGGDEMFKSHQTSQVLSVVLLVATGLILFTYVPLGKWRVRLFDETSEHICLVCLRGVVRTFLSTWASYIALLFFSPLLETEASSLLQLNVIWLCFLNSFWVAMKLCGRSFASRNDTVTDGFCSWGGCFTCRADEWNKGNPTSDCSRVKTMTI